MHAWSRESHVQKWRTWSTRTCERGLPRHGKFSSYTAETATESLRSEAGGGAPVIARPPFLP